MTEDVLEKYVLVKVCIFYLALFGILNIEREIHE